MSNKSANLYARIEPEVKEKAEQILMSLGLPVSNAINIFYKQIILHNGLPFEVKLPRGIQSIDQMTKDELNIELEKAYQEYLDNQYKPAELAFSDVKKKYKL